MDYDYDSDEERYANEGLVEDGEDLSDGEDLEDEDDGELDNEDGFFCGDDDEGGPAQRAALEREVVTVSPLKAGEAGGRGPPRAPLAPFAPVAFFDPRVPLPAEPAPRAGPPPPSPRRPRTRRRRRRRRARSRRARSSDGLLRRGQAGAGRGSNLMMSRVDCASAGGREETTRGVVRARWGGECRGNMTALSGPFDPEGRGAHGPARPDVRSSGEGEHERTRPGRSRSRSAALAGCAAGGATVVAPAEVGRRCGNVVSRRRVRRRSRSS